MSKMIQLRHVPDDFCIENSEREQISQGCRYLTTSFKRFVA